MEPTSLKTIEVETQSLNSVELETMPIYEEEFLPIEEEYDGNEFLNKIKACI